jgi:protein-tyrosine phosphatase
MDKSNYANVIALAKTIEEKNKVKLLLEEAGLPISEVPDPYYGGADGFDYVYDLIDKACDHIADTLENGEK